jgi:hypothetical protein
MELKSSTRKLRLQKNRFLFRESYEAPKYSLFSFSSRIVIAYCLLFRYPATDVLLLRA